MRLPILFSLRDGRDCLIRATVEEDARELCEILPKMHAESQWLNYMPGEFDKSADWERCFIKEQTAKPAAIMLVAEVNGRIVATAGAGSLEYRRYAHHAELGLAVLKDFWGQGLGRRLTELLVEWGRARGLRKMYLKAFDGNERAIALYEALGFKAEARLRDDYLRDDGTFGDTITMGLNYPLPVHRHGSSGPSSSSSS
jgi:RimJ/RimL family protein N-acetyltransferase